MKLKFLAATGLFLICLFLAAGGAEAIYDPLSRLNNRVGVHILSPDEIEEAARLVNNDGQGSWGYVTLPIQATDRDRQKWLRFMEKAAELKVIPIVRIATFAQGSKWAQPDDTDLIDFANFLNDLPWPIENRYVIIFNEVNRADEYGGVIEPEHYAAILGRASEVFKKRSDKFFILPAGLDNAAPNGGGFIRWDAYLQRMWQADKEIFNKIDGWTSHAYPNPDFAATPTASGSNKIDSFKFDLEYISRFSAKKLPVFITETGWSSKSIFEETIADLYSYAFIHTWSDERIVAVTPFLLRAGAAPFNQFSLINPDNQASLAYGSIAGFAQKGEPQIEIQEKKDKEQSEPVSLALGQAMVQGAKVSREENSSLWQRVAIWMRGLWHGWFEPKGESRQVIETVKVDNKQYRVEIVRSVADKAVGLSKYAGLKEDEGMLFEFAPQQTVSFWMKGMSFDIDIVWIRDNLVTGVTQGLFKDEFKPLPSPGEVDYVLEVSIDSGIKPGDELKFESR